MQPSPHPILPLISGDKNGLNFTQKLLVLIEWFRLMRPFITGGRRYNHSLKGDHDHLIEVTTKKS